MAYQDFYHIDLMMGSDVDVQVMVVIIDTTINLILFIGILIYHTNYYLWYSFQSILTSFSSLFLYFFVLQVAETMNWDYYESVQRFHRILDAQGISEALKEEGAQEGDLVMIG